jgi:hypothetical protein
MLSHIQGGIEIPCRNDSGAHLPKMIFYVEGNQGFILDKKHELSRK